MLKAEVTKEKTLVEIMGDIPGICSDLANLISGINKKLKQYNPKVALDFKRVFTASFMDGICFDETPEHMLEFYQTMKEMKEKKEHREATDWLNDFLKKLEDDLNREAE